MSDQQGGAPRRPALFYGWRIVWALALTQTVGYGVLYYAFGVLVRPMEAELGFTRAQTGGAFSVGLLVAGLAAVPVGRLVDRSGGRAVMTVGALFGALLLVLWSRVTSLPALYAVWVGLGLAMGAVLYEVAFTVVAAWFRQQRARATFVITLVAGLASTVFTPLTTLLVTQLGWRSALLVLGGLLAGLAAPLHAVVLRSTPQVLGLQPDGLSAYPALLEPQVTGRQALGRAAFWWLALGFALSRFAFAAMGAHLVPLLSERGLSAGSVAGVVGAVGPLQLLGRVVFVPLSARWSTVRVTALLFGALGGAFLALLLPGWLGVLVFVLLYGTSNGATTLTRATLTAELFGSGSFGFINGAVALIVALVSACAPLLMGALYSETGGYAAVLWALAGSGVAAVACMTGVREEWRSRPSGR